MKIALLTDGITPYVIGGMQKHSFYLAKYFAREAIKVDLYHFQQDTDIQELSVFTPEEKEHITSIVLEFPKGDKLPGHYIRASHQYSERIFEALKDRLDGVDFIYAKGFCAWKLLEEKQKGMALPPVGVKFHGMNMYQVPPSFKGRLEQLLFRPPVKFNLNAADYVFSYGGKITDIKIYRAGVPREKIIEIPTGIERGWIAGGITPPHTPRQLLYIGRYERLKGIEELTKALARLEGQFDFQFHFVGDIPKDKQSPSAQQIYHGKIVEVERLQERYRASDVLVLPSYSEGMPNVILEAMASAMTVIATDVGAVRVAAPEGTGWLIPAADQEALTKALTEVLKCGEEELQAKKQAGYDHVRTQLLWENIIHQTIDKIKAVIG